MIKTIITGFFVSLVLFAAGCKEDELKTYDGPESVYFNMTNETNTSYVREVTWGFADSELYETVIDLRVMATGDVLSVDRRFEVEVVYEDNAVRGTDYDYPDELIFPANASRATLPVTVHRGPDGDNTMKYVQFMLVASEDFRTDLKYLVHSRNSQDTVDVRYMSVGFTSELTRPTFWNIGFMGYFSAAKYILVNQLCGLTRETWETSISGMNMAVYATILTNYMRYRLSLGHEEALKDPNPGGKRGYMTMGSAISPLDPIGPMIPDNPTEEWPDYPKYESPSN